MDQNITIRQLSSINEIQKVENIQRLVWSFTDREITPASLMVEAQKSGGLVLGAYDNVNNSMVGFLFGFVGFSEGTPIHCSSMMAVLPNYRGQNIGFYLKKEQRLFVLSQGVTLIKWTFDPLESQNAYLNLGKLGGKSKEYKVDLYGTQAGDLNRGLPTDRLFIEWKIDSKRVSQRLDKGNYIPAFLQGEMVRRINVVDPELHTLEDFNLNLNHPTLYLEIPPNIQKMKHENIQRALEWRLATREIFLAYLSENYIIADFLTVLEKDTNTKRCFYVFEKQSL